MSQEVILSCNDVSQAFSGLVAVDHVSLEVRKNEIVGIIGPNGAGKTTLFNDITGIYTPSAGTIDFCGENITGLPPHIITAKGMARTFQNIRLFNNMMVIDNVMVGSHTKNKASLAESAFHLPRHRAEERAGIQKAAEILKLVGLSEYRYSYAHSLPYGMQRRLEIARALASDPKLILLDEPAAGMNEQETNQLLEFIQNLRKMENTILLIEHDMRLVMNLCDRIYVLNHGELIASGSASEIQSDVNVIEAYLGKEV